VAGASVMVVASVRPKPWLAACAGHRAWAPSAQSRSSPITRSPQSAVSLAIAADAPGCLAQAGVQRGSEADQGQVQSGVGRHRGGSRSAEWL